MQKSDQKNVRVIHIYPSYNGSYTVLSAIDNDQRTTALRAE